MRGRMHTKKKKAKAPARHLPSLPSPLCPARLHRAARTMRGSTPSAMPWRAMLKHALMSACEATIVVTVERTIIGHTTGFGTLLCVFACFGGGAG